MAEAADRPICVAVAVLHDLLRETIELVRTNVDDVDLTTIERELARHR